MKRILSMFIAVIMVFSMLPTMVFASAADAVEGTGATESTEAAENTGATDSTEATEATEPVEPAVYVAEVGGAQYTTLLEAVNSAQAGDTIKLIADYAVTASANQEYNLRDGSTLDLGGHILNVPYMTAIFQGNATIQNGTVSTSKGTDYALWIGNGSEKWPTNITLKNLTVDGGVNVFAASATFENCTVDASEREYYAVWGEVAANITIKSGTYTGGHDKNGVARPAVYDYKGGVDENGEEIPAAAISVAGGTFSSDVTGYLAPGTNYVQNEDGSFTAEEIKVIISAVGNMPDKLYPGEQIQLSAKILPEGTEGTIKWSVTSSTYFTVTQTGLVTYKKYTANENNRTVKATATLADGSTVLGTYKLSNIVDFAAPKFTVIRNGVDISADPTIYPGDTVDVKVSWEGLDHYGLNVNSEGVSIKFEPRAVKPTGKNPTGPAAIDKESISVQSIEGGARLTALSSLSIPTYLKSTDGFYLIVRTTLSFNHNGATIKPKDPNDSISIKNDISGDFTDRAYLLVGKKYQLYTPHLAALGEKVTWLSNNSAISVDENDVMTVNSACTNAKITASVTAEDGTTYKSYQMFSAIAGPAIATLEINGNTDDVPDLRTAVKNIPANETAVITMKDNFTYDYDLIIDSGKNVTLNLGDFTISRTVPSNTMAALWVTGGASLTINSGEKGSVVSSNGADGVYAVSVGTDKGVTGTVTINGGNFYGNTDAVYVMMGTATINGGTFEVDNPELGFLLNCYDPKRKTGEAKIIVNGGEFKGFDPQNNAAEGTGTNFVNPELTSMDKGDGTFVIMKPATVNFDEFGFTVGETMSMDVTLTDDVMLTNTEKDCTVYLDVLNDGKWQQVGQEIKAPADAVNGKYSFTFSGIPMVYLSNNMRARMISHDEQGEEYGKTVAEFGEEGAKENISFAHYAKTLKTDNSTNKELCDLLNSMLNYITEAQKFKGYNTVAPANSELKDEEKQVTSIMNYTDADWSTYKANKRGMTSPAAYKVKFTGSQLLMLSDKTGFRFHFTADSAEGLEMKIEFGGKTVTVTEFTSVGNGEYTAEYAGFAPTAIDTQLKVVINKGGEKVSNIVYDSIPATAQYITKQDKYADQRALMSAMLDYGKKATAYENKTSAN